jgi:arsenite methyltransferase
MDANETYQLVQNHYGAYAKHYDMELNLEHSQKVAQAFGYTLDEIASIPEGANLGVSCGNPLATAKLKRVC